MSEVTIDFGALAEPLDQQLERQGFINVQQLELLQRDADEISRLFVRGLIGDAETQRARKRLPKSICAALSKASPPSDRQEGGQA